ncbi:MAG TPA: hypothetical protein VIL46_03475 [Gemmataceae bacterium]
MASDQVYEFGYRHGRQVSHFLVDVTAHGRDNLSRAPAVAFSATASGEKRATHFRAEGARQLTLFARPPWSTHAVDAEPFPDPLACAEALEFVWDWLRGVQYPPGEHDGASERG